MNRKNIVNIMQELEKISENNYNEFEVALLLFLRTDIEGFENMNMEQLEQLKDLIDNCSSLLDIEKEDIDSIIESGVDNE